MRRNKTQSKRKTGGPHGTLNDADLKNLERLYFYQIAVCDYYGQYYDSQAANRGIYLQQARFATRMLKHVGDIS